MGTPDTTGREFPHRVNITRPFYLGITEVTQAQWLAVMGKNRSTFEGDLQRPVERVSWNDCQQFLERINQSSATARFRFRLPTEAEWEYACRAGTTTKFYFGDDPTLLPQYAWLKDNANETTRRVGQKAETRMPGVCTICTEMFTTGAATGLPKIITKTHPRTIPKDRPTGTAARLFARRVVGQSCRQLSLGARHHIDPEDHVANPYGLPSSAN